jgi:very-short-patch-repair endonuclease
VGDSKGHHVSTSKVAPRTLPTLQRQRARQLRSEATPAERKLWSRLRAGGLNGHKFSRQIAIGPFICDLVCRRAKLVVELDGGQHCNEVDASRTAFLGANGYTVVRFWNHQVLQDVDSVLHEIEVRLEAMKTPPPLATVTAGEIPPPPAPPASGRGGV